MSGLQWAVKGILTHVLSCKQNSDMCHACIYKMKSLSDPHSITGHLRSTVFHDLTDPLRLNSFLLLATVQLLCRAVLLHMYVCFSCQCPCLAVGLCSQYTQIKPISVACSVPQTHTTVTVVIFKTEILDTSRKRNQGFFQLLKFEKLKLLYKLFI